MTGFLKLKAFTTKTNGTFFLYGVARSKVDGISQRKENERISNRQSQA